MIRALAMEVRGFGKQCTMLSTVLEAAMSFVVRVQSNQCTIWLRNSRARSCCGFSKKLDGVPVSTI